MLLVALDNLPTDDLLGLCPDKMFLVGRQNAEGELLPCAGLPIHHICALVHVDGALREGGRLQVQNKSFKRGSVRFHSHQQSFSLWLSSTTSYPPTHGGGVQYRAGFHLLLGEQCPGLHWRRGRMKRE